MKIGIVWFRRDLRLDDHVALHEAALECDAICPAFVVHAPLLHDARMGAPLVDSFFSAVSALRASLRASGSDLAILRGDYGAELLALARRTGADCVFFNDDYEPAARRRDDAVAAMLQRAGLKVRRCTDHVYFGAGEILQTNGEPYRVFTPYRRRWLEMHTARPAFPRPSQRASRRRLMPAELLGEAAQIPSPEEFGFPPFPAAPGLSERDARLRLRTFLTGKAAFYGDHRDFPAQDATSRLSSDLRAGTIGIRTCLEGAVRRMNGGEGTQSIGRWIDQLIWRDFYQQILAHFPHVEREPFIASMQAVPWRTARADLDAWREGRTGYPLVDAAMRQLDATGWMHNRLRMVTASFLTKQLLIDWREGELHFAKALTDSDMAQNNGGWQWAASTGTDAAPYFRMFNPTLQGKRFDPQGDFVRRFVPELRDVPAAIIHEPWRAPALAPGYPPPIVEHGAARQRALEAFAGRRAGS